MTTEVLHCNFCKRDSAVVVVHNRAVSYCSCGSNNLVRKDGTFIGPPAKF